jgi:cytochrome c oxidase assembly factor CtaG
MGNLSGLHFLLGTIVVVAYVLLALLNLLRANGRAIPGARMFSFVAAGLLLLQYVIGGVLWSGGFQNSALHYVIALLAIVPVGIEHGYASTRATPRQRAMTAALASVATAVLVLAAHGIGSAYQPTAAATLLAAVGW